MTLKEFNSTPTMVPGLLPSLFGPIAKTAARSRIRIQAGKDFGSSIFTHQTYCQCRRKLPESLGLGWPAFPEDKKRINGMILCLITMNLLPNIWSIMGSWYGLCSVSVHLSVRFGLHLSRGQIGRTFFMKPPRIFIVHGLSNPLRTGSTSDSSGDPVLTEIDLDKDNDPASSGGCRCIVTESFPIREGKT